MVARVRGRQMGITDNSSSSSSSSSSTTSSNSRRNINKTSNTFSSFKRKEKVEK